MTGSTPLWLLCSSWTSGESRGPPSQGTPTRGPQTGLAPPELRAVGGCCMAPSFVPALPLGQAASALVKFQPVVVSSFLSYSFSKSSILFKASFVPWPYFCTFIFC